MSNKHLLILTISIFCSCNNNSETEKYQSDRNNVINVKDKLVQFNSDDIFIGSISSLFITDDYLIIVDHKTVDHYLHFFDKKNFTYITGVITRGQGPGEIANIGHIEVNNAAREIFVSDHGKQKIFSFKIDSLLADSLYMPTDKMILNITQFPNHYQYINDTLSMGVMIEPTGNSRFNHSVAKFNFKTGEIKTMPYKHPDINKKRNRKHSWILQQSSLLQRQNSYII